MKRMNVPQFDAMTTYDLCVQAVGDPDLQVRYLAGRTGIQQANGTFDLVSQNATWATLPRTQLGHADVVIAAPLCKQDMMDLYTSYMVGAKSASREVYDGLLTAAGGLCPFCGGLGHAWTLDHYLPKAYFPAYSVHPCNLVPCCRDCNTGKNASFGQHVHEQTLHPYLDQIQFFNERWITATVNRCDPILIIYQCSPPENWLDSDQQRVRHHFVSYKLARRFCVQAGSEISKLVQLRQGSLRQLSPQNFQAYLLENANCADFVLNGWSRTMYAALADTEWFVQADFNDHAWHF